jgi:inorganic pyrophosphatase
MDGERYLSRGVADESRECIVEIPKGSRNKYEFDHERDVIKQLKNKNVEVEGWFSRDDAIEEIKASQKRFRKADGER